MNPWAAFFLGMLLGGITGVVTMCLCIVSGRASRYEEQEEQGQ